MLSLYHSSLLERSLAASVSPTRPTASSHARYTHYWTTHSRAYALLARTLTLVSYTELLLEMTLRKRAGQPAADKLVLVLEVLKALARIGLLGITRRVGVNPPLGEREVDPAVLDGYVKSQAQTQVTRQGADVPEPRRIAGVEVTPEIEATAQLERDLEAAALATAPTAAEYWQGSHTGLTRPTLASIRSAQDPLVGDPTTSATAGKDAVQAYLLSRVLTSEDVKSPRALMSKVGGVKTVAEMVWILRPLIYGKLVSLISDGCEGRMSLMLAWNLVYAMKKYGRRHTFPFLLSLALEYLSYSLRSQANAAAGKGKELSEVEKAENAKRFKAFWRYLVRGPVWDGFTK